MIFTAERQLYNKAFKTVWIIYSIAGALVLLAAVLLPPQTLLQNTPACYSVKQFGKQCFMCGSTRSFIHAGHGNFIQAVNFNRLALVLFFTAIANTFIFIYYLLINNLKKH